MDGTKKSRIMFIGHFGIGLGAKRFAPKISLGMLFLSAQFLDLLWPTLLLLGVEKVKIEPGATVMSPLAFTYFPYTHSLLMACIWGLAIGILFYVVKRDLRGAAILALCVLSHWILDLLVHRPDLPLTFQEIHKVGFGWWNQRTLAILSEGLIFVLGLFLYLRNTRAKNGVGRYGFWAMIVMLVCIHMNNLLGPVPTSVNAIAWAGQLQWIFVVWAFWVDRNRNPVLASGSRIRMQNAYE